MAWPAKGVRPSRSSITRSGKTTRATGPDKTANRVAKTFGTMQATKQIGNKLSQSLKSKSSY